MEWGGKLLQDGVEDVYMFLDDQEGGSDTRIEQEELPTAVVTMLTKCYSVTCDDENPCYSYSCPRKVCYFVVEYSPGDSQDCHSAMRSQLSPPKMQNKWKRRSVSLHLL